MTAPGEGRICRFAPAGVRAAIDANIAAARLDAGVGALPGGYFVMVRGTDPAATAQQQPMKTHAVSSE